ncbi:unnamed protein product [Adineta ricciae]|uniref:Uncharacterized protein n=1 Tax=Adineta ricciae TaxID=249248 RepID=A0A813MMX6_ADIRI|nr:unnamed protein product [Adineta ricciae]CAF1366408.1 unnamed protein product [Adineta ricciae]
MDKQLSEVDWSQVCTPLTPNLFDKYIHQSILPPLSSLNINEITWNECRTFALKLAHKGFDDPLAILYTSFKRFYPSCPSIRSFSRWLKLFEKDHDDFKNYFKQYSVHSWNIQSLAELTDSIENLTAENNIGQSFNNFDQIWFLFSISIRPSGNDVEGAVDTLILDDGVTRLSARNKRHTTRMHCIFALTPSGKFSNQLIVCKQVRCLKNNFPSSEFTRIVQTPTGDISYETMQQWFEDFISLPNRSNNSAILIDPRMTLLTPDIDVLCQKSNVELVTIDLNYYLIHILTPIFSLFDQRYSETNRVEKMCFKPANDLKRIIYTIWCSLRTLKQNEQICQIFKGTPLWRDGDELYLLSTRAAAPLIVPKKKKKKILVKTGNKKKLSSSMMMTDPPSGLTPEQILSYVLQRQLSISRASKCLGGVKLDYLKYCLSYKSNSSLMTGSHLVQLNAFMQSQSTVDWLRHLRSLYFWPCAKQLFLREIYQLTGIITRKRSMNMCANGSMGSIRSCDLQSPGIFWRAFEDIHQIQFDNESVIDVDQLHDDFHQYLREHKLNQESTQLWTIDTFEFPLTKKSTVLQLPEWNELRPMNLTPKVTVLYAFSSTGQMTEPYFIFPLSLRDNTITDGKDSYNELGHLTPQIFLTWIENHFSQKLQAQSSPTVLVFCSRLPVLSPVLVSSLEKYQIHPFGYPYTRTLPFRYLFERRVRNNRSTNLISELWKKKLLDEQRTHVLKDSTCTVQNIKHYFEEVWCQILHEKRDDDDANETFQSKCQQAFQQANIQIKIPKKRKTIKIISRKSVKRTDHSTIGNGQMIDELNKLITDTNRVKSRFTSHTATQILKMNNHLQPNTDAQLPSTLNGTSNNMENVHSPSAPFDSDSSFSSITSSSTDKRTLDENDQSNSTKRLRSSSTNSTIVKKWIPSKQSVANIEFQSTSLFQFILSLISEILPSINCQFTDEHSRWIHSTLNLYGYYDDCDRHNFLIDIACKVAKLDRVR